MTLKRTLAAFCVAALPVLGAVGCGSSEPGYADKALNAKVPDSVTKADEPAAVKKTGIPASVPSPISTDLSKKPSIPKPKGDAPTKLLKKDVVTGKGPAAKSGDKVTVKYVGVTYSAGKQFDASWDRNATFPFTLGQGGVIQGWDQGVPGMKVGGRRVLVIPSDLAYGAAGSPPNIGPDEGLVFVVDLVKIG